MESYYAWLQSKKPEDLHRVLSDLDFTITNEVQKYKGPKSLLRSKAKTLAIKAVKTYDPNSKANLKSWVVTNLKPLSRYANAIQPVYTPEVTNRQAAELETMRLNLEEDLGRAPTVYELADHVGMSVKKIQKLQKATRATMHEGQLPTDPETGQPLFSTGATVNTLDDAEQAVRLSLSGRDKSIYEMKRGIGGKPLSVSEIAKRLGVSPAYVSNRLKEMAHQILALQRKVL